MLYPFLTLPDGTEIVYSEIRIKNGKPYVNVKFERWNDTRDDFDSMDCYLPNGTITNIIGFSSDEVSYHQQRILELQNIIMEHSRQEKESIKCL